MAELGGKAAEQARAPERDLRVGRGEAAADAGERVLGLCGVRCAESGQVLAVRKGELEPSDDGREAAGGAVRAGRLLPVELPRVVREVERLAPRLPELLFAAEGEELYGGRRDRGGGGRRHRRVGRAPDHERARRLDLLDRQRRHVARVVQLLEQVDDDVRVAGDDEDLHVLIDVAAALRQLWQQEVPVVELGDRRVILLERVVRLGAERLEQPRDAHAILKLEGRRPVEDVRVQRRRGELLLADDTRLHEPVADGGR